MPPMRVSIEPSSVIRDCRLRPRWRDLLIAALGIPFVTFGALNIAEPVRTVLLILLGTLVVIVVGTWIIRAGQRVQVTAHHLIVPRSDWSRSEVAIPYDELEISGGTRMEFCLEVRRRGQRGKPLTLWAHSFPNDDAFFDMCSLIRVRKAAAEAGKP